MLIPISSDTFICAHPSMAKDNATLYFTSDMPGGFGGNDIYVTTYNKRGKQWTKAKNLGPSINTSGNEVFPFIKSDGVLYFSSDTHDGMGGLDIFKSTKEGDAWGKPENLQYPVNSTADDFSILFKPGREEGLFASNRIEGRGRDDIYEFLWQIYTIKLEGYAYDKETKEALPGGFVTLTTADGQVLTDTIDSTGFYSFELEQNRAYDMEATLDKFLNDGAEIGTYDVRGDTTFTQNMYLQNTVKPIILPNILYDVAKWDLRAESKKSLDILLTTLNGNPNITIELGSHTDNRGDSKYNKSLAAKRAKACVDYLIENNIEKERLTPKGYGEDNPRELEEDLGSFKAGDIMGKKFIRGLDSDDLEEEAHQLNRRTSFKVLETDFVSKRVVLDEDDYQYDADSSEDDDEDW